MPIKIFADYGSVRELENDINTWASGLDPCANVTHLATSVGSRCRFGPIRYLYSPTDNTITVAIWYSEVSNRD